MAKVYLAVGHGRRPDGTFDPGAVAPDGTREYDVARRVAEAADAHLDRSGVQCYSETEGHGPTMDPNYVGSVSAVNGKGYDVAVSVHLDWHKAPRGGFGLYRTTGGRRVADAIAAAWAGAGLPQRANAYREDLYFINKTDCPAVIWECDRVGADVADEAYVQKMAEALARGICAAVGVTFVPPVQPRPYAVAVTAVREPDQTSARLVGLMHGFKYLPPQQVADADYVVAVGYQAQTLVDQCGDGVAVSGPTRADTEQKVVGLLKDTPPRRRPWSTS